MQNFRYRIRIIPVVVVLGMLMIGGWLLFPTCPFKFEDKTFKGSTEMGTIIALNFTINGGEITGYGCHLFSSGKENFVTFSGSIDCKSGQFEVQEHLVVNNYYFGEIRGMISDTQTDVVGGWTNSFGEDYTEINLSYTEKSPEEVIRTESPKYIQKKAMEAGRKVKQNTISFLKGLFN